MAPISLTDAVRGSESRKSNRQKRQAEFQVVEILNVTSASLQRVRLWAAKRLLMPSAEIMSLSALSSVGCKVNGFTRTALAK